MKLLAALSGLALALSGAAAAQPGPQQSPQPATPPPAAGETRIPGVDAQFIKEYVERLDRWRHELPQGTGPGKVSRIVPDNLRTHTVYWPATGIRGRLPIVAFANGGCRNTSVEFTAFLSELASHGYFIVAIGTNDMPFRAMGTGTTADGRPLSRPEETALTEAVDWALAENRRAGSPFRGRLETRKIAYMGQSCGGVTALNASTDPRTTTTVVLNSGYFNIPPAAAGAPPRPMMNLSQRKPWSAYKAPIAFFVGGPTDMASRNATANYREASGVPMFKASLPSVGHAGAYPKPDPQWSQAVLAWLDWQLKGDRSAAMMFRGTNCGLCRNQAWQEVESKGL